MCLPELLQLEAGEDALQPWQPHTLVLDVCDLVWVLSSSEVALGKQDVSGLGLLTCCLCVCWGEVTLIAPRMPEVMSIPEDRVSSSGPTPATQHPPGQLVALPFQKCVQLHRWLCPASGNSQPGRGWGVMPLKGALTPSLSLRQGPPLLPRVPGRGF